ncbi:LamG domain-containing protein [Marinobacter apostichopi]|uniref:LamG domain-containing protein n=1 Tax=Marinobacter apostichopi TaxID=3035454 RepID=UPI0025741B35|nr:LamG domain-containing protein [Marinobacter sp. LA51]
MTLVFEKVLNNGFDYALEFSEVFSLSDTDIHELPELEQIGFIAFSATPTSSFKAIGNVNVRYESQNIDNGPRGWDDGCDLFGFNSAFGSSPIVLASKTSRREDDGGWLRQCQLSASNIGLTIDEDDYQDSERSHGRESIGLLAFSQAFTYDSEARPPVAEPLMLESRSVTVSAGSATTVNFDQVYPSPPAVFVLGDDNNPEPSSVRIRNVTEQGFEVLPVEPPLGNPGWSVGNQDTTIHYLAATYGQHQFPDGTQLEVGQLPLQAYQARNISGSSWSRLNFLSAFSSTPAFISQIQSTVNETSAPPGRSDPWLTMAHDRLGVSGIDLALERAETRSGTISSPETVAYLAIEAGVIGAFVDNDGQTITAEAQVTPDQIGGTRNCDSMSFLQSYPAPPRVIGSQVSRDGGDGGWLRRCSVSNASVDLKIEEDWASDQDLSHTTEEASFLAFSDNFAVDFSLRAIYGLEGPRWQGDPGEVKELRGTGLDGQSVGGAMAEPAQVCYGATLSGGSYVDIPHDPELSADEEFTVMAWINIAALPSSGNLKTIVSKDENYEYHVDSNGELFWWWNNSAGATRSFTSGYQLPTNTWVHTAITYSRRDGVQRIVVDGVERARQTFTNESLSQNTDPFQIGADQGFAGREFEGQIDEVRLYGRALSNTAILREANRSRPCSQVLDHFRITVPATASVCAPVDVQIQAEDAGDNLLVGYQGTVNLTTSTDHGNWQRVSAAGSLAPDPDSDDDGQVRYQFDAADNGSVTLGLANSRADRLTITARDTSGGQSGVSSVVEFRENALVVSLADTFGADVIAGRPHGLEAEVLRRDPSSGECGRVEAYDGPIDLRAWLDRQGDDPSGAAPDLNGGSGSVTLPSSRPGSTNLTMDFVQGLAQLTLSPSDVGHYALELEDSESGLILDENDAPRTITGTSAALSVRPFGFAVTVAGNPAATGAGGTAFLAAGRSFDIGVRAVQYDSADDSDLDGQPDGHNDNTANKTVALATNNATLVDNATVVSFDDSVALNGYLIAGPPGPPDPADPGLAGPSAVSGFSGGSVSGPARYNEVGVIEVATAFSSTYLGRAIDLVGDTGPVGRFHPEHFSLEGQTDGVLAAQCNGFTYTGQSFGYATAPDFTIAARAYNGGGAGLGPITRNYRGDWQKLDVDNVAQNLPVADSTQTGNDGSLLAVTTTPDTEVLTPLGNGSMVYRQGPDTFVYTRNGNARVAPFDAALEVSITSVQDSDSVALSATDLPVSLPATGTSIRYGRLVLENAYGPEDPNAYASTPRALQMPFEAQIWNGSRFTRHTDENCWVYNTADALVTDTPPNTSVDARSGTMTNGIAESDEELLLTPPGAGNTGSVMVEYPVPVYWQDDYDGDGTNENPSAIATFGVYRGHDRVIYWQER